MNNNVLAAIKTVNPVTALLNFNIVWYGQVMKFILLRYKILILFILLLLAPTLSSLMYIVAFPAKNLVSLHTNYMAVIASLMAYQGLGLMWVLLQQSVFSKQPWDKYLSSLPVTKNQKILSETIMLALVNFVIWIPLLLAGFFEIIKNNSDFVSFVLIIEKIIINMFLILLVQLAWRKHKYTILSLVFFADASLVLQEIFANNFEKLIFISFLISASFILINLCFRDQKTVKNPNNNAQLSIVSYPSYFNSTMPFVKIQLINLLKNNAGQLIIPIVGLLIVLILSILCANYSDTSSTASFIISSCMMVNGLILSNIFARINTQRKRFSNYLTSLPISRTEIFVSDMILLSLALVTCNLVILLSTMKSTFAVSIISLLTPIFLLSVTYFPQIKYKRYGFFISMMITPIFIWVNYLLFNYIN